MGGSGQVLNTNGPAVMKRGRGRPPGTRNKSTLIAQAKLVAQQQAKANVAVMEPQLIPALPVKGRGGPTTSTTTHRVKVQVQHLDTFYRCFNIRQESLKGLKGSFDCRKDSTEI